MKVVVILADGSEYEISSVKEVKLVDDQGNTRVTAKQTRFGIVTDSKGQPIAL